MPRQADDHRIYRTFEEFEREEIRRLDAVGTSVDDQLNELFLDDLDFDSTARRHAGGSADEEDGDDEE